MQKFRKVCVFKENTSKEYISCQSCSVIRGKQHDILFSGWRFQDKFCNSVSFKKKCHWPFFVVSEVYINFWFCMFVAFFAPPLSRLLDDFTFLLYYLFEIIFVLLKNNAIEPQVIKSYLKNFKTWWFLLSFF